MSLSLYKMQEELAREVRLAQSELHNLKTWCLSDTKPTTDQVLARVAMAETHLLSLQKLIG